jgi:non-ribosomal peptide synthase protein (TIGR01720 family)
VYPIELETARDADPGERLTQIKEQLRAIPNSGIGYGLLRYLSPDAAVRAALARDSEPDILFNYLGQFDRGDNGQGEFRVASGPRGRDLSEANRRTHPLVISCSIHSGCLWLHWIYGTAGPERRDSVKRLASEYIDALLALIGHPRLRT